MDDMADHDNNPQRDAELETLNEVIGAAYREWVAKRDSAIAAWEAKWNVSFYSCSTCARPKRAKRNRRSMGLKSEVEFYNRHWRSKTPRMERFHSRFIRGHPPPAFDGFALV
jgi:hypothetical protein